MNRAVSTRPELPVLPSSLQKLDRHIEAHERLEGPIKPDNEARIVWCNTDLPEQTPYSIVYLHGFTASQGEGDPVHRRVARETGSNLYLSRLRGHGLVRKKYQHVDEESWLESARYALAVGAKLGKKVVLMGTSTGGTLALYLAANYPEYVHSIILFSPLVGFANDRFHYLEGGYINRLAEVVLRNLQVDKSGNHLHPLHDKYWYPSYRMEEVFALIRLIKKYMNDETFRKVHQPLFMGYYYKSRELQDNTVSVRAMLDMYERVATIPERKHKEAYPDADSHVITCKYTTIEYETVGHDVKRFLQEVAFPADG